MVGVTVFSGRFRCNAGISLRNRLPQCRHNGDILKEEKYIHTASGDDHALFRSEKAFHTFRIARSIISPTFLKVLSVF